jgi:NAD+ diphosphatase
VANSEPHLPSDYSHCPYDGCVLVLPAPGSDGCGRCPRCGFVDYRNPVAGVGFFILDAGSVLLGKRGQEPAKGMWDILGGFIDYQESAEEAVLREAKEETDLRVRIVAYLGSVPDVYGPRETPTLNLIYVAVPEAGRAEARSDVAELKWFRTDEIPGEFAFEHQKTAIEMLRNYLKSHEG